MCQSLQTYISLSKLDASRRPEDDNRREVVATWVSLTGYMPFEMVGDVLKDPDSLAAGLSATVPGRVYFVLAIPASTG